MYIRLTSRCNMRCKHCCYSCTSKGQDMTLDTFKRAMQLVEDYGSDLSIGGGEPTLHPEFWQFLGYALSKEFEGPLWLATNGKRTADALALAKLAKTGAIACALSQDKWHERVEPRVVQAFTRPSAYSHTYNDSHPNDFREIRNITAPFNAGRWKSGERRCVCPDLVVQPDGKITQCGCLDSPVVGNVRSGIRHAAFTHECWKPEESKRSSSETEFEHKKNKRPSQEDEHE